MAKQFPQGAQEPSAPHPGSIAFKYAWNKSTKIKDASKYPEDFIFRCADAEGEPTDRAHAVWCIPLVEVETVSVARTEIQLLRATQIPCRYQSMARDIPLSSIRSQFHI